MRYIFCLVSSLTQGRDILIRVYHDYGFGEVPVDTDTESVIIQSSHTDGSRAQ